MSSVQGSTGNEIDWHTSATVGHFDPSIFEQEEYPVSEDSWVGLPEDGRSQTAGFWTPSGKNLEQDSVRFLSERTALRNSFHFETDRAITSEELVSVLIGYRYACSAEPVFSGADACEIAFNPFSSIDQRFDLNLMGEQGFKDLFAKIDQALDSEAVNITEDEVVEIIARAKDDDEREESV